MTVSYWIDKRVKVEGRQVWVFCLDVDHRGCVVPGEMNMERQAVVQVGEGNAVLSTHWLTNDDLINIIELIPILFPVEPEYGIETGGMEASVAISHPMSC